MSERPVQLRALLADVKRRWTWRSVLRAWTLGAMVGATVIVAAVVATLLLARDGLPLVFVATVALAIALGAVAFSLWPCRRPPSDSRLARLIEERNPELNDVLVTAVDCESRQVSPRMRHALDADAARALAALDLQTVVPRDSIRQAAIRAAAASVALAASLFCFAPALSRATNVASAYLFPARLSVQVTPGSIKVPAGTPVTITVKLDGPADAVVPTLVAGAGTESRAIRMAPTSEPATFSVTVPNVTRSFTYSVVAAAARSADFNVTVVRAPHVERIDLHYEFPPGLGLEPRTDEDSGDIYGPAGTKVRLTVVTDKPIANGTLVLDDGTRIPLAGEAQSLEGALTIEGDGSYRVALADVDGLQSSGDTEYFIRTLDDRPPDVRILRPASDKHVTALEEVLIEARADDDYGIASFDLVFQAPGGPEKVVPLRAPRGGGLTASGVHTLFMEELGVSPGDFVTYYARARDVNRGRRAAEARSDIFFLEVKPFEEEFVAAQSQAMGQGGGMQGNGLEGLAEAQKEIIVATWKLDARARRARDARSQRDIKAVATAQSDLRARAEKLGSQTRPTFDARRRRAGQGPPPGDDPMGRAVEAMGRAVNELEKIDTATALPHEMEALNQLLKAEAEVRRRQVTRQQQAGTGGGMNRAEADLSNLFDQELRRRQETNYESPNSTEERQQNPHEDPLERIRELARRQDALNRQQQDLLRNREQVSEDELKRQLERLTREQNELRQQAEQLGQRLQQLQQQQGSQQSQSGQSSGESSGQGNGGAGQDSRRLREISEDMRNAATGMRRQDSTQASESGSRASQRLRDLERQMQASRPDDRRRALGDLQLETRQLADAQRRVANEATRSAAGQAGDDARRRLAGDQERLAERVERLQEQVKQLSRSGQGDTRERAATSDAARELERQKVAERMRQSAESLRQTSGADQPPQAGQAPSRQATRQGDDLARALDRIADRLGAATGTQDAESRRWSDALSKTQDMRDRIAELEQSIDRLKREGAQTGAEANERTADGRPSPQPGQESTPARTPQQAQGGQQSSSAAGSQQSAEGQNGSTGQQGSSAGGNGGRLQQLQREVNERAREVERLTNEIRRENPGMQGANPDEGWWRSVSAPGTEAFKQDFARWESLKKNLLISLEGVESKVSGELRARENNQRFNAGGHQAVSEAYRALVERYYRSLASPRKPQ